MRVSAECFCRVDRHAAAYVIGVLDTRRASDDDLAVLLLELLELVEHAEHENPGMRGSEFLPRGGPSPGQRVVEVLLPGVYTLGRGRPVPPVELVESAGAIRRRSSAGAG